MDFLRSILTQDDPDPESISNNQQSDTDPQEDDYDDDTNSNVNSSEDGSTTGAGTGTTTGGLWSFGDIVKTLTTKSESVFETYRRDLKEFGSGLRKESDLFREVASRAVKELPDVGSSVIKTTSEIISQGKEALLISSDDDSDRYRYRDRYNNNNNNETNVNNRYSRYDVQLSVIRSDERTYLDEPEDMEEYKKWKLGFVVGEMRDEIERLVSDKGGVGGIYERVVPDEVDDGTFWFRYFYKVYKLRMQEDMRARLVKRSLSVDDDEEELSWDVDDDDEEEEDGEGQQSGHSKLSTSKGEGLQSVGKKESRDDESKGESLKNGDENEKNSNVEGLGPSGGNVDSVEKGKSATKLDKKVDNKVEDSKVVVKSDRPLVQEEEDLEWDEIEDLGDNDDKKVTHGETTDKVELRKRLSTAADDEDLSWDIEDDDDDGPTKAGTE